MPNTQSFHSPHHTSFHENQYCIRSRKVFLLILARISWCQPARTLQFNACVSGFFYFLFTWVNLLCELLLYLFCEGGQQCWAPSNSQCQVIKRGIFQKDYCSKLLRSIFGEKKYSRQRLKQSLCYPTTPHTPFCLPILQ